MCLCIIEEMSDGLRYAIYWFGVFFCYGVGWCENGSFNSHSIVQKCSNNFIDFCFSYLSSSEVVSSYGAYFILVPYWGFSIDEDYYSYEGENSVGIFGRISEFSLSLICLHDFLCNFTWWWVQSKIHIPNRLWFCTIIVVLGRDYLHVALQHAWFQIHQQ